METSALLVDLSVGEREVPSTERLVNPACISSITGIWCHLFAWYL